MKNKVKILIQFIIMLIIILQVNFSLANTSNIGDIEKIREQSTSVQKEDLKFDKKIESIDKEKKEIKIKLSLKTYETLRISSDTEVIFVLDNSGSMDTITSETQTSRKVEVSNAVKGLVDKINENNSNVKMGIVQFSSGAGIMCALTNDKQLLYSACNQYEGISNGNTNIYAGIQLAKSMYSSSTKHKVMIVLTDGIPTEAIEETTVALKDANIYTIAVLTGLKDQSSTDIDLIHKIFGTEQNPAGDKFYNINDKDIENTICKNIYQNILDNNKSLISNIEVKDYFTEEILNNFDITINQKNIGEAEQKEGYIEWKISQVLVKEQAFIEYTLKLKDNYDRNIENKVLDTNREVTISYVNDEKEKRQAKTIDNPQIKLIKNESNINTSNNINKNTNKDNTVANSVLPKAGNVSFIILSIIVCLIVIIALLKYNLKKYEE